MKTQYQKEEIFIQNLYNKKILKPYLNLCAGPNLFNIDTMFLGIYIILDTI